MAILQPLALAFRVIQGLKNWLGDFALQAVNSSEGEGEGLFYTHRSVLLRLSIFPPVAMPPCPLPPLLPSGGILRTGEATYDLPTPLNAF